MSKINYKDVQDSFIATFGKTNFAIKNKPRVGISPRGIWLGHAHPEVIVDNKDNTIPPVGVIAWEQIKSIEISDISQDGYGFIVFILHNFDSVWEDIPKMSRLPIKSACVWQGEEEGSVLAYPAHVAFDFNEYDYQLFLQTIKENDFADIELIGSFEEYYKPSKLGVFSTYFYSFLIVCVAVSMILKFIGMF